MARMAQSHYWASSYNAVQQHQENTRDEKNNNITERERRDVA